MPLGLSVVSDRVESCLLHTVDVLLTGQGFQLDNAA